MGGAGGGTWEGLAGQTPAPGGVGCREAVRPVGAAAASKFLAVGASVPAAAIGAGALATQADVNLALKRRGIELMADGASAGDALRRFFAEDAGREERQAGAVDARGGAGTFTGARCQPWAGGQTGEGPEGSFAVQGNILTGAE